MKAICINCTLSLITDTLEKLSHNSFVHLSIQNKHQDSAYNILITKSLVNLLLLLLLQLEI